MSAACGSSQSKRRSLDEDHADDRPEKEEEQQRRSGLLRGVFGGGKKAKTDEASTAAATGAAPIITQEPEQGGASPSVVIWPPETKLTKQFLIKPVGIDDEFVETAYARLREHEVGTVGAVVGLSEDKLENKIKLSTGSVSAILRFIEGQNKLASLHAPPISSLSADPFPTLDKTEFSLPSFSRVNEIIPLPLDTTSPAAFLGKLMLKHRNFVPREFVTLEERLWGIEEELDFVFVREWYAENASKILNRFVHPIRNTVIVAGNKGTGKTVFGIYLVVEALREGFAVIYETTRERILIVGNGQDHHDIENFFRSWNMKAATQPGVYLLKLDSTVFTGLAQCRSVVHIVDVGDSYIAEIDSVGPKVILSSPNFDKLKRINEVRNVVYYYLPLWSWEEIQLFNEKLPLAEEALETAYVRRDAEDLKVLFETFGGVPRTLFKRRSVMDVFDDIEKCLSDTSFEVLKQTFTFATFAQLPKALPGLLVHIKEHPSRPGKCLVEIASSTILYRMMRFYFHAKNLELISFLNAKSPPRMVGQIRGELVEICVHEAFGSQTTQIDLEMKRLGAQFRSSFTKIDLPPFNLKFFAKLSMADIPSIAMNDYFQPLICNFPAVDAIALMARSFFDGPGATGFCGVGFQATISKKKRKGVPRDELIRVRGKLRDLRNDQTLPFYLVFVSVADGLNSSQRLGDTHEAVDDEFAQFVIRGISFESLSKLDFMKVTNNEVEEDSYEEEE